MLSSVHVLTLMTTRGPDQSGLQSGLDQAALCILSSLWEPAICKGLAP